MRDPLRLFPSPAGRSGRWPPVAPEPPDAAEIAAHVAGQVGAASEPVGPAGPPPQRREGPGAAGPGWRPAPRAGLVDELPAGPRRDAVAPSGDAGARFHPVAPFGRPSEGQRAAMLSLVDGIGLHLVCPEPLCRRAKRCRDPDVAQLPLCFWLHRGTCRFVLAGLAGGAGDAEPDERRPARRVRPGESLLARLRRAGWPIEQLARSREDGADEWSWEAQPEARALVDAFRGRTDGR